MPYQGPFASSTTAYQTRDAVVGERPESWREGYLRLYPSTQRKTPLAAMTARMKSESASSSVVHWFEKGIPSFYLYVNNPAGITATATLIDVDDGAGGTTEAYRVRKGHVLRNERTGEILWVTANPGNGTQITVSRNNGTGAGGVAMLDNDILTVIGTVHEENSSLPNSINLAGSERSNYLQTFREPFSIAGTMLTEELRTGPAYKTKQLDALEMYNMQIEMAFMFGHAAANVGVVGTNGTPERTTGGILGNDPAGTPFLSAANVLDAATETATPNTITKAELDTQLELLFRYGANRKIGFIGSTAMLTLSRLMELNSTTFVQVGEDQFGLGLRKWITPFGEIDLIMHPLFNVHPTHRSTLLVLDFNNLVYRYKDGRDTQLLKNRQNPGDDGTIDEYFGECGLEIHHPETHGVFYNLQNAA